MADLKIVADYSDIQVMRRELVGVAKDAKASASVFEREYAKAERQLKASTSSAQKYYSEVYKLDKTQKSAAQSASVFEKELVKSDIAAKTLAATKDRLASKYKPLYAQSKLYERSLEGINQANKLGVLTDRERQASVQRLNQEFATGTGVFSTYANAMGKGANRMGVAMQQTGYQVGDFLVQVQSGTNPMVAFGQQATQLVGVMYLLPQATLAARISIMGLSVSLAGITLGLSVLIPLLTAAGAAFMRTKDGAKEAASGADEYAEALERVVQKEKDLRSERLSLTTSFDEDVLLASTKRAKLADRIAELEALQVGLTGEKLEGNQRLVTTLQNMLSEETSILSAALAGAAAEEDRVRAIKSAEEKTKDLGDAQVKTYQDYQELVNETKNSQKDQLELVLAINKYGEDNAKVAELRAKQEGIAKGLVGEALKKYVAMEMVIRGVVDATEDAADAAGKISPALQSAVDQANAFANAMGRAASNSAGIGISTAGINAQIAALEGGSSKAEATAKGAAATLRAELTANLPSFEAGPRSSASIDRRVQERYSATLERENARAKLSSMTKTGTGGSSGSSGGASKKSPAEELQEYLGELQQQADLENKLVGLSGQKRTVEEAVIKAQQKYGKETVAAQEAELRGTLNLIEVEKERQRVFEEAQQQREQLVSSIESTLEDGFMSMVDGTKSVKDAFRDMARDIIKELYRVLVVKKMVASISNFFGFADGGAFSGGSQIQAYANGGVVGGPTFFPMAGGKTGLMGEAGPEAIMPLKRGANGKLGVQAEGGSQGNVVVNQSFNFQANGDDSVKKLIAQAAPQIANMTQKQIMDSRRRGGSMKAAFG